jgi:hypothetical protein
MSNLAGVNWRLGRAQSWSSRSPRRSVPSRGGGGRQTDVAAEVEAEGSSSSVTSQNLTPRLETLIS